MSCSSKTAQQTVGVFLHTLAALLFLCAAATSVFAASDSDTFIIRTLTDADTTPPTVPTGLTATPIATSQIDLTWDPSWDNFVLSGYQIFRDDVQIATTTATNYSDVGLIASTTYTYFVTAFDSFNNISASSTPVATTTLSSTTPPASSTGPRYGSRGTRNVLELVRLEIIPFQDSVILRYETKGYIRSIVRWGRSISYELGSIAERSFTQVHETKIMGLRPATTYSFSIEGDNSLGVHGLLTEGTFITLPPEDTFPPGNVTNLRAVRDGDDIVLTWENPFDPDFSHVRILRNDQFYPSDIADGWVVYEDSGESTRDKGAAKEGVRRFYTVFSYDELGNISSGAVVSFRVTDGEAGPIEIVEEELNPLLLRFSDLLFYQDGERLPLTSDRVSVDGSKRLGIMLPYERVPEHLKTILVTLEDAEGKEFAFLLRVNKEKSAYIAELAPFGTAGLFPLRITVFDFKTTQVGTARGTIASDIVHISEAGESTGSFFAYILSLISGFWSYLLLFILLILITLGVARKLTKKRDTRGKSEH